jgi:endonuclease/exonuclease/phosphatase family metal-dependent hydrolase
MKILCWNINDGRGGADSRNNSVDTELERVAERIRAKAPDIVLLNETRDPSWTLGGLFRKNQPSYIAKRAGLPYKLFGKTNRTGPWLFGTGWKGVAVLSRYPLKKEAMVLVRRESGEKSGFGTLVTSVTIDGQRLFILSARFAPHNDPGNRQENPLGILQAIQLVKELGPASPLLFGGDFNASVEPGTNEYERAMEEFFDKSELIEAVKEGQLPIATHRVDYLFYRGNYKITHIEFENPDPMASDHPWIFAVLERS